jgi:hypothetical protein
LKKYLLILFFSIASYSQTITQTYYDKCTGETKVYIIPIQGSTLVIYYNRSTTVTYNDVQSGAFQKWLEDTYLWWSTFNPCSAAQVTQNVVQQTTTQATQVATSAAAAAASSVSIPMPPPPPPAPAAPPPAHTSSSNNAPKTEAKPEAKSESKSEEKKEEPKQEEKKEDSKEEKKEESKQEKKEEKKEEKKKQQAVNPILIAANYMTMQNLDGSFNQVASFGLSQSSLTGAESYNANAMIWSNLKQFSLSLSKSTILFNYDKKVPVKIGNEILGYTYVRGTIYKITGLSITAMLMFDTKVLSVGMNDVFLLKKGLVFGYAFGGTFINIGNDVLMSPSLTSFITKPFAFKKYVVSPMVAVSSSPVSYTTATGQFTFSQYLTYIVGSNFDFNLTKRFKANLGITTINSTQNIPMTYAITIGSKIKL